MEKWIFVILVQFSVTKAKVQKVETYTQTHTHSIAQSGTQSEIVAINNRNGNQEIT